MRVHEYWAACRTIHAELALIAIETRNMALARCADPSNLLFATLMDRQDELHRRLAYLDQQPIVAGPLDPAASASSASTSSLSNADESGKMP